MFTCSGAHYLEHYSIKTHFKSKSIYSTERERESSCYRWRWHRKFYIWHFCLSVHSAILSFQRWIFYLVEYISKFGGEKKWFISFKRKVFFRKWKINAFSCIFGIHLYAKVWILYFTSKVPQKSAAKLKYESSIALCEIKTNVFSAHFLVFFAVNIILLHHWIWWLLISFVNCLKELT